jgi:hypothetical protein
VITLAILQEYGQWSQFIKVSCNVFNILLAIAGEAIAEAKRLEVVAKIQ